jgi:hypothetical protein
LTGRGVCGKGWGGQSSGTFRTYDAGDPSIPSFTLFGEEDRGNLAGFGHIETIAARSSLHDWEITPIAITARCRF